MTSQTNEADVDREVEAFRAFAKVLLAVAIDETRRKKAAKCRRQRRHVTPKKDQS